MGKTQHVPSRKIEDFEWERALSMSCSYINRKGINKFTFLDLLKNLGDQRFISMPVEMLKEFLEHLRQRISILIDGDVLDPDSCLISFNPGMEIKKCREALRREDSEEKIFQDPEKARSASLFIFQANISIAQELEKLERIRRCRDFLKVLLSKKGKNKQTKRKMHAELSKESFTKEEIEAAIELLKKENVFI